MRMVQSFFSVVKPGRHGPDAPPLAPASARYRSAPRARRAAGARHEVVIVPWLPPGQGGAHCAEPPPQRQARCASRSGQPLRGSIVTSDRHRDEWVMSGGAGRIGSKRLDPGAPAAPRPALPAGGACRRKHAPPCPSKSQLLLCSHIHPKFGRGPIRHTDRSTISVRGSGRPGESHPRAPTERNVTVSRHSALLILSSRMCAPGSSG